jgi:hypothetical protein
MEQLRPRTKTIIVYAAVNVAWSGPGGTHVQYVYAGVALVVREGGLHIDLVIICGS